ncbi:MAG: Gfo/Idh/MocA family oxidoreductase [Chloroflexota bacterium]|nr:Gfo/Idh/MocA family oxidoreductase [Chloroflexota bacterium]
MHKISMLGAGFIGMFYTKAIQRSRSEDVVKIVYNRTPETAKQFSEDYNIARWTGDMDEAINDPETDVVVVGLPNFQHKEAIIKSAKAGKAVLCTKPLARTGKEAKEILDEVEEAGVFHGYLEDLVYTPKTLKALEYVRCGSLGRVLWTRSRETHPGPHSPWFFDKELAGGGALVDMGCHCTEICRNFIGKDIRPVEAMGHLDTLVHPIAAEDFSIGLVRFENGSIGQIEASWTFRGGMDLRDEISGTEGTIWLNHWLRTGFEVFTSGSAGGYVSEKSEAEKGWLFPVGNEEDALGYIEMFNDMFDSIETNRKPREDFYDGYVVNSILDAMFKSNETRKWEPVEIEDWRGGTYEKVKTTKDYDSEHILIKTEIMPDGKQKFIIQHKETGRVSQIVK